MKRLMKLLSIFGVLIILGSCSSSKSVNVSENIIDTGYYNVTYKDGGVDYTDNYTYTVVGEITCVPYSSTDGAETLSYSTGVQISDLIKKGGTYTFYWSWRNSNAETGTGTYTKTFTSGSDSIQIYFLNKTIRITSN